MPGALPRNSASGVGRSSLLHPHVAHCFIPTQQVGMDSASGDGAVSYVHPHLLSSVRSTLPELWWAFVDVYYSPIDFSTPCPVET